MTDGGGVLVCAAESLHYIADAAAQAAYHVDQASVRRSTSSTCSSSSRRAAAGMSPPISSPASTQVRAPPGLEHHAKHALQTAHHCCESSCVVLIAAGE